MKCNKKSIFWKRKLSIKINKPKDRSKTPTVKYSLLFVSSKSLISPSFRQMLPKLKPIGTRECSQDRKGKTAASQTEQVLYSWRSFMSNIILILRYRNKIYFSQQRRFYTDQHLRGYCLKLTQVPMDIGRYTANQQSLHTNGGVKKSAVPQHPIKVSLAKHRKKPLKSKTSWKLSRYDQQYSVGSDLAESEVSCLYNFSWLLIK